MEIKELQNKNDEALFELAEKLADEVFGKEGMEKYSERQMMAIEFHKILQAEQTHSEQYAKELCLKAYASGYHKGLYDNMHKITSSIFDLFFGWCAENKLFNNDKNKIKEHDIVSSLIATEEISVGDKGTVVHIYPNGKAYEVEFADKKLVLTMKKGQIEKYKSTKTNL